MGLRKASVKYTTASTYNPLVVTNDQEVYQVQKSIGELIVDIATDKIDEIKPRLYDAFYSNSGQNTGTDRYYELFVMKKEDANDNGGSVLLEAMFGDFGNQAYCQVQITTRGGFKISGIKNGVHSTQSNLVITKDSSGLYHFYLQQYANQWCQDNIIVKKCAEGIIERINKYLPSPTSSVSGTQVWRYSSDGYLAVINPPNYYSPFSEIVKIDSSNPVTLGVGQGCVLYPMTATQSIGFKFSSGGSYRYVAAGTVVQNTSYATFIKTGTGISREYDVGQYYRGYYGTSSFTYSTTSRQQGIGINTSSIVVSLYTSVSCLACILKQSV